jgi:hypothetical protein
MNQDGRPIYFTGRIRDLDTVKESVYITINVDAWAPSVLRFRLECPLAETFRSERPGRAIVGVAHISDVRMTRDTSMLPLAELERQFLGPGRCLYLKTYEW